MHKKNRIENKENGTKQHNSRGNDTQSRQKQELDLNEREALKRLKSTATTVYLHW